MPASGAPTPVPVRGGYPKECRLRAAPEFQRVRGRGRRHQGAQSTIRVLETSLGRARLGLATPRAYGSAVKRNRFRRLAREAFRALRGTLGSVDLLVEPRREPKKQPKEKPQQEAKNGRVEPTLEGLTRDLADAARRSR